MITHRARTSEPPKPERQPESAEGGDGASAVTGDDWDDVNEASKELAAIITPLAYRAFGFQAMIEQIARLTPEMKAQVEGIIKAGPLPGD